MIQQTGRLFYAGGMYARDTGMVWLKHGYIYGGHISFFLATTSMIVLMPLMFEIAREGQVRVYAIKRYRVIIPPILRHYSFILKFIQISLDFYSTFTFFQMLETERNCKS
jgi:hypothetical protein